MAESHSVIGKMLDLAGKTAQESGGRAYETRKNFTAIELGFALGLDVLTTADKNERKDLAGFLDRGLAEYYNSHYCAAAIDTWVRDLGVVLPDGFNAGYTGFVLREKSAGVMKQAADAVINDVLLNNSMDKLDEFGRNNVVEVLANSGRMVLRTMSDEAVKRILEGESIVEEKIPIFIRAGNEYKPANKERG